MASRSTYIVIQFRRAPFVLFRDTEVEETDAEPTGFCIFSPRKESLCVFAAKTPGPIMRLGTVDMDFQYSDYFGKQPSTGYERLLHDCMVGDATLFQRADMVEGDGAWSNPMLDLWKALPPRNFPNSRRAPGDQRTPTTLLERDGRHWRDLE